MTRSKQDRDSAVARLAGMAGLFILLVAAMAAQAQTFTVLHTFTGGADGGNPTGAGLTMDSAGNLYGGAGFGGPQTQACSYFGGCGTLFKLTHKESGWIFDTLYGFTGGSDGNTPDAPLAFGPDGVVYGTTFYGGVSGMCDEQGCGTVFSLRPPPAPCKSELCPWLKTVLYRFTGENDGAAPAFGALAIDRTGNLYGTTTTAGADEHGDIYELAHDNGQWTLNVLHSFTGYGDGGSSWSGVTFDSAGNLYGTTEEGGLYQNGTAFELSPSGQGWILSSIHQFVLNSDGYRGVGNLLLDSHGNLWGTNEYGGSGGGGTAYELTPSNGSWGFSVLYSFTAVYGSQAPLVMDQAGNLYGTTVNGGTYRQGTVFELTPSGGGWNYTVLHNFTGGGDGGNPYGQIVQDARGNLYGTTLAGGRTGSGAECEETINHTCGVVWEITP